MAKAIAGYAGGIQNLIEKAVRADGAVFTRYQDKGRYGYVWGAWKYSGKFESTENLPRIMESGFSTLYRMRSEKGRNFEKWRLPND